MRRQRGYQPGKTTPIRPKAVRTVEYQAVNAGIARSHISADEAMAAHFDPTKYIEKFPHGYDPFAGSVTALQKKVVFRPNKYQLDAIMNRVKPGMSVNVSPGKTGSGPFIAEKPRYKPKNDQNRLVDINAVPFAEVQPRAERPDLEKRGDRPEVQAGYVYEYTEDPEVPIVRNNKHRTLVSEGGYEVDSRPAISDMFSYTPVFKAEGQPHKRNNSIQDEINARVNFDQGSNGGAGYRNDGHNISHKDRNNNSRDFSVNAGYSLDADGIVDVGYVRTRKDMERHQRSDYAVDAEQQLVGEFGVNEHDDTLNQQHRQRQGNLNGDYNDEFNVKNDLNMDVPEIEEHAKPDVRQNRRHQTAPKKKYANVSVEINANRSTGDRTNIVQTRRQQAKPKTNNSNINVNDIGYELEDHSKPNVRQNRKYQPGRDGDQAEPEFIDDRVYREDIETNQQNRRYQSRSEKNDANPEFNTDFNEYEQPKSQNRRYQAQSDKNNADPEFNIDSGNHEQPKSQNRRYQAQSDKNNADPEFNIDSDNHEQPKSQNRRYQARSEVNEANPEFQVDTNDYEQPKSQNRRYQAQSDKNNADPEFNTDFNEYEQPQSQNRRHQAKSDKNNANPEFNAEDNDHEQTKSQRRRYQARSDMNDANPEFNTEQTYREDVEIHQQNRRHQSQPANSNPRVEFQAETRELKIPNTKPKKHHKEGVVMVASKMPDIDVKTRVQDALTKSRTANNRHNVNQETPAIQSAIDPSVDIKTQNEKVSNRRQYSAKQAEEYSHPTVNVSQTNIRDQRDINADRNNVNQNRQHAHVESEYAHVVPENQTTLDNNNLNSKLAATGRSNRREKPDIVAFEAGIQNDNLENNSLDPRTLMSTDSKFHLARPDAMASGVSVEVKEERTERTGQEFNTRQRNPIIKPSVGAGKNHNVKFVRVKKSE